MRWGLDEPYRMLTSRNEHRLLHRQDNARSRLVPTGVAWGTVEPEVAAAVQASDARIEAEFERLANTYTHGSNLISVLCRPGYDYDRALREAQLSPANLNAAEIEQLEIRVRYDSYIKRSQRELDRRSDFEGLSLAGVDYTAVPSLSGEGLERLKLAQPGNLGAASRLRGVRDSDVTALLVHLRQHRSTGHASG